MRRINQNMCRQSMECWIRLLTSSSFRVTSLGEMPRKTRHVAWWVPIPALGAWHRSWCCTPCHARFAHLARDYHAKRTTDFKRSLQQHKPMHSNHTTSKLLIVYCLNLTPWQKRSLIPEQPNKKTLRKKRGWHITPIPSSHDSDITSSPVASPHLKAGGTYHGILQDIAIAVKNPQFFVKNTILRNVDVQPSVNL